jgi:hypothetical protein
MKILKKLILVTLISILAFGCSDDDDSGDSATNGELIGTWQFSSSTTDGQADNDNYICDFEETYTFTATTITTKYYWDPSGEDGSDCQLDGTYTSNYSRNGNTLMDEEGFSIEIKTLNSTTLVLEDSYTYDDVTTIYTETYTRQ